MKLIFIVILWCAHNSNGFLLFNSVPFDLISFRMCDMPAGRPNHLFSLYKRNIMNNNTHSSQIEFRNIYWHYENTISFSSRIDKTIVNSEILFALKWSFAHPYSILTIFSSFSPLYSSLRYLFTSFGHISTWFDALFLQSVCIEWIQFDILE